MQGIRQRIIGLDIGGANLKAAHTDGTARLVPFALWKQPELLGSELRRLIDSMPPFDLLAVTMTGELCDCFESKRQGVNAILDAVEQVARGTAIRVWRNDGVFVEVAGARQTPLQVAAANWLALASYAGRFAPERPALLIDIGSTTTDIVPLHNGKPVPKGRTDPERLNCHELVYLGVRRTPLCALFGRRGATEFFATTLDAYLVLDMISEDPNNYDTADGRPATKVSAHARLARMRCADLETTTEEERLEIARLARHFLKTQIHVSVTQVIKMMPALPRAFILSGTGEFIADAILETCTLTYPTLSSARRFSLSALLTPEVSQAGPAYALAILAADKFNSDD
jgi:probable H4MPT-linked C1 transfer pathway protein